MSGKTDTFVLDFVNDPDDIQKSFQPYYQGTILTEETDPNHLYTVQQEIEKHNLYHDEIVERFVKTFYDETIPDEKLQGILDSVVESWRELDKDDRRTSGVMSRVSSVFTDTSSRSWTSRTSTSRNSTSSFVTW